MEYTNSYIKGLICERIHSQRDRRILFKRMVDGWTYERIGEHFSLSTSQIKRIVRKYDKLFRELPD